MRGAALVAAWLVVALAGAGCLGSGGFLGIGEPGPRDYVSGKTYSTWIVEVDVVGDAAPPGGLLDFVKGRLESVVDKPGGVEFRVDSTKAARGGAWSDQDIRQFDRSTRDLDTSGKTVVLHLLFLDGHYISDGVLGVTYSSGSSSGPIAIFSDSIKSSCSLLSTRPCTDPMPGWRAVVVHEFGHAMGLVNHGAPMVHPHEATTCNVDGQDRADSGHSSNQGSVMFCTVEQSNLFTFFASPPNDFDSNDRADLCGIGGKC